MAIQLSVKEVQEIIYRLQEKQNAEDASNYENCFVTKEYKYRQIIINTLLKSIYRISKDKKLLGFYISVPINSDEVKYIIDELKSCSFLRNIYILQSEKEKLLKLINKLSNITDNKQRLTMSDLPELELTDKRLENAIFIVNDKKYLSHRFYTLTEAVLVCKKHAIREIYVYAKANLGEKITPEKLFNVISTHQFNDICDEYIPSLLEFENLDDIKQLFINGIKDFTNALKQFIYKGRLIGTIKVDLYGLRRRLKRRYS